jgi:hypothetical protein
VGEWDCSLMHFVMCCEVMRHALVESGHRQRYVNSMAEENIINSLNYNLISKILISEKRGTKRFDISLTTLHL